MRWRSIANLMLLVGSIIFLIFSIIITLIRWDIGRISEHNSWIEDELAFYIDDGSASRINADWGGRSFSIEMEDVSAYGVSDVFTWNLKAREIRVLLTFFSVDSLWVKFDLQVYGMDLQLQQQGGSDGSWLQWLKSWPLWNIGSSGHVSGNLQYLSQQQLEVPVQGVELSWNYRRDKARVQLLADKFGSDKAPVEVQGKGSIDDFQWFLRIGASDYSWLSSTMPFNLEVGVEAEGRVESGVFIFQGFLIPAKFRWQSSAGAYLDFNAEKIPFSGVAATEDIKIIIGLGGLVINNQRINADNVQIWYGDNSLKAHFNHLPVDPLIRALSVSRMVTGSAAIGLREVAPSGVLGPFSIEWKELPKSIIDLNERISENIYAIMDDITIRGSISNIHIKAWNNVPLVKAVNAYCEGTLRHGTAYLASDSLDVKLAQVFDKTFNLSNIQGSVIWDFDVDRWRYSSTPLCGDAEPGRICAQVSIRMPPRQVAGIELSVLVGVADFDARYKNDYIPKVAGAETAIEVIKKQIELHTFSGGVAVEGLPGKDHKGKLGVKLAGYFSGGVYEYLVPNPPVRDITGLLRLDTKMTRISASRASIGDVVISSGKLDIRYGDVAPRLQLDAYADANTHDFISTGKAVSMVGPYFDRFSQSAKINGNLAVKLNMQWELQQPIFEAKLRVGLQMRDIGITSLVTGLGVDGINGKLQYSSDTFITANDITAIFAEGLVRIQITSDRPDGHWYSKADIDGEASLSYLSGLDRMQTLVTAAGYLQGYIGYQGNLDMIFGKALTIEYGLRMDTSKLTSNIPWPLDFPGDQNIPVQVIGSLNPFNATAVFDFNVAEKLSGRFVKQLGDWQTSLTLGTDRGIAEVTTGANIVINGSMPGAEVIFWGPFIADFIPNRTASRKGKPIDILFDFHVDSVSAAGASLGAIDFYADDIAMLNFTGKEISGSGAFVERPMLVDLDYLRWNSQWPVQMNVDSVWSSHTGAGENPAQGQFPGIRLSIKEFDVANLSQSASVDVLFNISSNLMSAKIDSMYFMGFDVDKKHSLEPLVIERRIQSNEIHIRGNIVHRDIGNLVSSFDLDFIKADRLQLNLDLIYKTDNYHSFFEKLWDNLNGTVVMDIEKGQLKFSAGGSFAFKVLGALNFFEVLKRIAKFDYAWIFVKNIYYDKIKGSISIRPGSVFINKDIRIRTQGGNLLLNGVLTKAKGATGFPEIMNMNLRAQLPFTKSIPLYIAATGNLPAALVAWVVGKNSQKYKDLDTLYFRLSGPLAKPIVQRIKKKESESMRMEQYWINEYHKEDSSVE